jgi:hypothetical protein
VSEQNPEFAELVADDDPERDRLQAAHELLLAAGAPPELPPQLQEPPPEPRATTLLFPRRRFTAIGAVAAAAAVLFGVGYTIGGRDSLEQPVRTVAMTGQAGATATIDVMARDAAGNWPMTLEISGLPKLPDGETYTLWLTDGGELARSCGEFAVAAGTTKVPLNAPYSLKEFDGWVVVRTDTERPFLLATGTV